MTTNFTPESITKALDGYIALFNSSASLLPPYMKDFFDKAQTEGFPSHIECLKLLNEYASDAEHFVTEIYFMIEQIFMLRSLQEGFYFLPTITEMSKDFNPNTRRIH